jgi:copper chaperone CopZ
MDRRRFICQITAAAAAGAAANLELARVAVPRETHGSTAAGEETRSVTYQIKGFTCITCAVGLEVMLRGLKGVTRANASYPANNVVIGFDEQVTDENELKAFIRVCGFSVA